jgi:hypothetical protein
MMIVKSDRASDYFETLYKKQLKRHNLSQKERIFIALFTAGEHGLSKRFFDYQMIPKIKHPRQAISVLRKAGFVIDFLGRDNARYVLNTEVFNDTKRKWWHLW